MFNERDELRGSAEERFWNQLWHRYLSAVVAHTATGETALNALLNEPLMHSSDSLRVEIVYGRVLTVASMVRAGAHGFKLTVEVSQRNTDQ